MTSLDTTKIKVTHETAEVIGGQTWTLVPNTHRPSCEQIYPYMIGGYGAWQHSQRIAVCRTDGVDRAALQALVSRILQGRSDAAQRESARLAHIAAADAEAERAAAELAALRKVAEAAEEITDELLTHGVECPTNRHPSADLDCNPVFCERGALLAALAEWAAARAALVAAGVKP